MATLYGFCCFECELAGFPELDDCPQCDEPTASMRFQNASTEQVMALRRLAPDEWAEFISTAKEDAVWWAETHLGLNTIE